MGYCVDASCAFSPAGQSTVFDIDIDGQNQLVGAKTNRVRLGIQTSISLEVYDNTIRLTSQRNALIGYAISPSLCSK